MTSARDYDSQLAALHILGSDYYEICGVIQSTSYTKNKVIFDGENIHLMQRRKNLEEEHLIEVFIIVVVL